MKISILMPTYNDSNTIIESINSLFTQTYTNFELIVIDDGSNDNTRNVISDFKKKYDKDNKLVYIYEDNKDQLNALKNGLNYVTGEYILVFHSDDLLYDNNILKKMVDYVKQKPELDGIISGLQLIDENNNVIGFQKTKKYINKKYIMPLQLLFLGRNLYVDVVFCKKDVFKTKVYNNYLTWNGPFWLNTYDSKLSMLNIETVDFSFIKYRVFTGNYINSEIGLLNVFNGELRLVLNLMKYYSIPAYQFQYYLYRIFNKLHLNYRPLYFNKETGKKFKILKFIYNKRFTEYDYNNYKYYSSILNFFKNYKKNKRIIYIKNQSIKLYFGSDMRSFNKKMLENKLDNFYKWFLDEVNKGFNKVVVPNKKIYEDIEIVTKFLGIRPYIEIEVRKK